MWVLRVVLVWIRDEWSHDLSPVVVFSLEHALTPEACHFIKWLLPWPTKCGDNFGCLGRQSKQFAVHFLLDSRALGVGMRVSLDWMCVSVLMVILCSHASCVNSHLDPATLSSGAYPGPLDGGNFGCLG